MDTISKRFGAGLTHILAVLKRRGVTQASIARQCNMSPTSMTDYKNGEKDGSEDKRREIASLCGYSYEFVLELGDRIIAGESGENAFDEMTATGEKRAAFIPVEKALTRLSAGSGSLVVDDGSRGVYHFRADWLHSKCAPADVVLFDVDGDSMEPTITGGGVVLVNRGDQEFRDGRIFAIRVGDYVRIKRLFLGIDQKIRIVSDNSDKNRFPDEYCDAEELHIIGRVFWHAKEL